MQGRVNSVEQLFGLADTGFSETQYVAPFVFLEHCDPIVKY